MDAARRGRKCSLVFFLPLIFTGFALVGCGKSADSGKLQSFIDLFDPKPPATNPPNRFSVKYGTSGGEGGSVGVFETPNNKLSKVVVGGPSKKDTAVGGSFKVRGGINANL